MKLAIVEVDRDLAAEWPAVFERVGIELLARLADDAATGAKRLLIAHADLPEACAAPFARPWLTIDERDGVKTPRLLSWELVRRTPGA